MTIICTCKYLAFSALLAVSVSGANAQDWEQGLKSAEQGNFKAALINYLNAAQKGDSRAMMSLGAMYEDGEGVPKNYAEAMRWFRQAAEHGATNAYDTLGLTYEIGKTVEQNYVKAHMWFNISSANGGLFGGQQRDLLEKYMTREEIAKAQAMAQECMSSGYKNCGE